MNPTREEQLFQQALAQPVADRESFLERECNGDGGLRRRLEVLLAAHEQTNGVLATTPDHTGPMGLLAPAETLDDAVGRIIGRYKLLEKLGEGGCGVVYVAEQTEPVRRRVALKLIKPGMDSRAVIARFEAERQALALMDHPNIAKILDAGVVGPSSEASVTQLSALNSQLSSGRPYFVMELVRGIKITDYCDQNQLSIAGRLDLFIKVCQAIQHAHQKGIIHRDIKPSNILVTLHDGVPVPKVIDFGIAKAIEGRLTDATVYTQLHQFIGTPAYMSPEQAEMSGLDIDTRSDIYSLGVLLYELLTGVTPFSAERLWKSGLDEMRRIIREDEPQRPSARLTTLSLAESAILSTKRQTTIPALVRVVNGDLDWIVMKALEKDRARRYESANNFAQDVQRHLSHEPVVACSPRSLYRLGKFVRRNKLAVAATSAVAAALVIGLAFSLWALIREREAFTRVVAAEKEQRRERDRAATLLSVSQAERGVRLLEGNDSTGLLHLLEARRSVEHLPEERALRTFLWNGWYDSAPRSERKLLRTPDPLQNQLPNAAFCVEREWVATSTGDGQVLLWNMNTGRQLTALKTEGFGMDARLLSMQAAPLVHLPLEFSAGGRLLAAQSGPYFELWNMIPLLSNQPPRRLVAGATRLVFDPQRKFVATIEPLNHGQAPLLVGEDPTLQVIKVWSEETLQIRTSRINQSELNPSDTVALSPGGTQLAIGGDSLRLRNLTDGTWIGPSPRAIDPSTAQAGRHRFYSPEGRWLWEGTAGVYQRYDARTGSPVGEVIPGYSVQVLHPLFSPDGRRLVFQTDIGLQLLDPESGEAIGPTLGYPNQFSSDAALTFSGDGKRLAAAGRNGEVHFWDALTGRPIGEPVMYGAAMTRIAFRPDGELLGVKVSDGMARIYQLNAPEPSPLYGENDVTLLALNRDGHVLTHTASNNAIQWLDPTSGKRVSAAWENTNAGVPVSSALTVDGKILALAFPSRAEGEATIRFFDATTGEMKGPALPWASSGPLAFSADGQVLGGVSRSGGSVQLWNVAHGEAMMQIPFPKPNIVSWRHIEFSPDGNYLATQSGIGAFGTWHLWDLAAPKLSAQSYFAISPDWKRALASTGLVDLSNPGEPRAASISIPVQALQSISLAKFSPDSRLLAVASERGPVRLWDVSTGNPRAQVNVGGKIREMIFSENGRILVTAEWVGVPGLAEPGYLRVWDADTGMPCGLGITTKTNHVGDLWLDPKLRFIGVSLVRPVSEGSDSRVEIWKLPSLEMSLSEMQRRTWFKLGRRLDGYGNLDALPVAEWNQLESTTQSSP